MDIQIHNKTFEPFLGADVIEEKVAALGQKISLEYNQEKVYVVCVLKGAFMFFSDLIKHINIDVEVDFIRMKSYEGTSSSGTVKTFDFGILNIPQGSNILIVEDIIDTGTTLIELNKTFQKTNPKSLKVASLLFKKEAYKAYLPIDYYAFEIPNNFVVGYGLDFDELGRNLPEIYKLKNT